MRSYQTARTYFTLLEMASWAAIALGALLGIFGLLAAFSANTAGGAVAFLAFGTALLPAFAFCGAGLAGLVYAQAARAGVDSAEYALQGLQIARESLEVSKRALSQGGPTAQGYAAQQAKNSSHGVTGSNSGTDTSWSPSAAPAAATPGEIEYKGRSISSDGECYRYNTMSFQSLESAQKYIDQLGPPMRQPVPTESKA